MNYFAILDICQEVVSSLGSNNPWILECSYEVLHHLSLVFCAEVFFFYFLLGRSLHCKKWHVLSLIFCSCVIMSLLNHFGILCSKLNFEDSVAFYYMQNA